MRITATITEKGQITIPKVVRDKIGGRILEFILEGESIQLKCVPNVGGSLATFYRMNRHCPRRQACSGSACGKEPSARC